MTLFRLVTLQEQFHLSKFLRAICSASVALQIIARLLRTLSGEPQNSICPAWNVVYLIRLLTLHGTEYWAIASTNFV